jgi:hypothetical protein
MHGWSDCCVRRVPLQRFNNGSAGGGRRDSGSLTPSRPKPAFRPTSPAQVAAQIAAAKARKQAAADDLARRAQVVAPRLGFCVPCAAARCSAGHNQETASARIKETCTACFFKRSTRRPPHDLGSSTCPMRGLTGNKFERRACCQACNMWDVYGRRHDWGPQACPCFTVLSLARATFWRNEKSTRLVLVYFRRSIPSATPIPAGKRGLPTDFTTFRPPMHGQNAKCPPRTIKKARTEYCRAKTFRPPTRSRQPERPASRYAQQWKWAARAARRCGRGSFSFANKIPGRCRP